MRDKPTETMIANLHPEAAIFNSPGGMFDTPADNPLEKFVGSRVEARFQLGVGRGFRMTTATVVGTQYDYAGTLMFRAVEDTDVHRFGFVLNPADIVRFV